MKFTPFRHIGSAREREKIARIRHLLSDPGILHGSVQLNRRRCGKPTCRCAAGGEPHTSLYLRVRKGEKQVSVHVPASWEERVRAWVRRDGEIRRLLLELSDLYLARLQDRKE